MQLLCLYKLQKGGQKWAKWLQHKLEYYKLPVTLKKQNPSLPNKIRPIFRDTTDLDPGFLTEKIKDALNASKSAKGVLSLYLMYRPDAW